MVDRAVRFDKDNFERQFDVVRTESSVPLLVGGSIVPEPLLPFAEPLLLLTGDMSVPLALEAPE